MTIRLEQNHGACISKTVIPRIIDPYSYLNRIQLAEKYKKSKNYYKIHIKKSVDYS